MGSPLRIVNGRVYDPANGVNGAVQDVCVRDGKIVADVPPAAKRIDAAGMVVMPGGIDIHCHIAGPKVNLARKVQPETHRDDVQLRTRLTRSGTGGTVPSTFTTGYRYATLGYTTAMEAAVTPLGARHTLEEFHDTPVLDKGFFVLVGNNLLLYRLLQEGRREELRHALAWWLKVTKAYAPKLVNPGGDEMWKGQRNANITSLDDKIGSFDLTPRRVIAAFIEAGNELGLPHPVHIHCNNLGHSGNVETTLETMRLAEGRRAHIAHIQFHSYGAAAGKSQSNPTSRARDIVEYINTHANISADVGAVMFGPATIMTGDAPLAYMLRRFGGNKWVNADTENESGCGIVPFRYQDRVYTNALQWAIGLELLLLSEDPWRMVFSTDHPNGGSFMSYPRLIRLLMDRGYRKEQMAHVNQKALDRSALRYCQEREYSLFRSSRAPGRPDSSDKEKMFSAPRYVIKDGELIIEDHELRADHQGRLLHVAPDYDPQIEQVIEPFFEDFYTIRFANYPVDDRYVPNGQIIPTTPSVAAAPATAGTRP